MKIKRLVCTLLLVLAVFSPALSAIGLSTTTCPGDGCVTLNTGGQSTIGVQITGTFVGTLTFYASVDNTNYVAFNLIPAGSATPTSTATTTGLFRADIGGFNSIRVGFSAYTSGTAVVTLRSQK